MVEAEARVRKPGRGKLPVKKRRLLAREARTIKKSLQLSFSNPEIGYYAPCAELMPKPQASDFHGQPLDWSSEKSVLGEFEVWGPAIPGDNSSLPEPREVLFAGENGFLVVRIKNKSNAPVVVTGGTVQSGRSGPAKGRTQAKLAIPPRETVVYTVPITVTETAEAA